MSPGSGENKILAPLAAAKALWACLATLLLILCAYGFGLLLIFRWRG